MLDLRVVKSIFDTPRIIFTMKGNPRSEAVIAELKEAAVRERLTARGTPEELMKDVSFVKEAIAHTEDKDYRQIYRVFGSPEHVLDFFRESGISPNATVVLFDTLGTGNFTMHTASRPDDQKRIPSWAWGAHWAVAVHTDRRFAVCARQVRADFLRKFESQLSQEHFPWGNPRKGERPPAQVVLPPHTDEVVRRLNIGPNLASAIEGTKFALELPAGSRISWYRVAPRPILCDEARLSRVVTALREFERASAELLRRRPETAEAVLAGVELADDARLPGLYLNPPTDCFSIDRPDLHYTGSGLFASEVDEMPGGFPDLAHMDAVYELNQDRWKKCFHWLTERGLLLFIVSHEWSKGYIEVTKWFVEYLAAKGYPVHLVTTDALADLEVNADGAHFRGMPVGTIWRQFPIFETRGTLVELVAAAQTGGVRMVPEFGHFGNKVWFSLFRKNRGFFRETVPGDLFAILEEVLPDSVLIRGPQDFPATIAGAHIATFADFYALTETAREKIVVKVCGANADAARSYGVRFGDELSNDEWREWINQRVRNRQPFIAQTRLHTSIERMAVKNMKRNCGELFDCRILIRPWSLNGELVGADGCAVPRIFERMHGMVDMARFPVEFGQVGAETALSPSAP